MKQVYYLTMGYSGEDFYLFIYLFSYIFYFGKLKDVWIIYPLYFKFRLWKYKS